MGFHPQHFNGVHDAAYTAAYTAFNASHNFSLALHLDAFLLIGSHAYGTATAESDYDYFGIVTPPARYLLGLHTFESWAPGKDDANRDTKVYSIAKFVKLAVAGNPNVIEMLFLPEECYLYTSMAFLDLLRRRDKFLSKQVFKRFSGYALGQFQKMEQGKKQGYMGHKRQELVEQLGYDPKDASRLVHLLFMAQDIALKGEVNPRLGAGAHQIVMEIKQGLWSLDDIKRYAQDLGDANEALFQRACPLPDEPDRDAIENILISIHRTALR